MKRTSLVWNFFSRIEDKGRCVRVVCQFCQVEYKYFANTTNLRDHMIRKHPIQWDFADKNKLKLQNSSRSGAVYPVNENTIHILDDKEGATAAAFLQAFEIQTSNEDLNETVDSTPKQKTTKGCIKQKINEDEVIVNPINILDNEVDATAATATTFLETFEINEDEVNENTIHIQNGKEDATAATFLQAFEIQTSNEEWIEDPNETVNYTPKQKTKGRIKRKINEDEVIENSINSLDNKEDAMGATFLETFEIQTSNEEWLEDLNETVDYTSKQNKMKGCIKRKINEDEVIVNPINILDNKEDATAATFIETFEIQASNEEWLEDLNETVDYTPKQKKMKQKVEDSDNDRLYLKSPIQHGNDSTVSQKSTPSDEYSAFGEYIANELRNLKAPRTRENLQQIITTVFWQAEYGSYADADSVNALFLSPTTNPIPP